MASKSDSDSDDGNLLGDIDDAKNAMSDIEQHMKLLEGYNRDLIALSDEGETEATKKKFEQLKANIKLVGEEINRLFRVLGDDPGPEDPELGFGGGSRRKRKTKRRRNKKKRKTKKKRRRRRKK